LPFSSVNEALSTRPKRRRRTVPTLRYGTRDMARR
jgi:hypothetical protein